MPGMMIQISGLAAILAPKIIDSRIRERRNHTGGVICRSIIDDDQLPIFKGLFEDGLNRLPNVLRGIKCRHDDADSG